MAVTLAQAESHAAPTAQRGVDTPQITLATIERQLAELAGNRPGAAARFISWAERNAMSVAEYASFKRMQRSGFSPVAG